MKHKALAALMAGTFLFALPAGSEAPAAEQGIVGAYTIVAARRASDVAGGPDDESVSDDMLGRTVEFGETLVWTDGKQCESWSTAEVPDGSVVDLNDPLLSDLGVGEERRGSFGKPRLDINGWTVTCDGEYLGAVQYIDRYVLVVPSASGLTNLILERPQSQETIALVQHSLQAHGLYEGEITGEMDAATRRAIAERARELGAEYTFDAGVLTAGMIMDLLRR